MPFPSCCFDFAAGAEVWQQVLNCRDFATVIKWLHRVSICCWGQNYPGVLKF